VIMMANERLCLNMTVMEVLTAMCGEDSDSQFILREILVNTARIDPDTMLGGIGAIWKLDSLHIYDERIYMLWNGVCQCNVAKMIAVLRAHQLGQLAGTTEEALNFAIDNRGAGLDLVAVVAAVKEQLPNFDPLGLTDK